ncbi:toll/interleukin-1 receptor domain-containing protein [Psychroserpens mesophilus]|uniref:toll/interleukin-1 receptor domain-containing protein n=1 Tax=Psychroserpens mesophilus TaxID=325473 RepID=UPI0006938FA1|nr:toll/interleukin-1 receptor domain-containing protein [Psychroserpens mesophilus]
MKERLTVFISYSWDSDEHKEWVLKLANYLIEKAGCNVILDQFDLAAGKELTHFMENGLEKADKVIIILTKDYKKRAENRQGGTGFEYSLISQGLYDLQSKNDKFIPILRQGTKSTSAPAYLGTKIYHSMKDDTKFENDAFNLSRLVYEKPEIVRPELGEIPDFNNPYYDPIISVANEVSAKEKLNKELDRIIDSEEGVQHANQAVKLLFDEITEKAYEYNEKTDFTFKVESGPREKSLLIMSLGYTVTIVWYIVAWNSARGAKLSVKKWNGYMPLNDNGIYYDDERPKLKEHKEYAIDLNDSKQIIWRLNENDTVDSNDLIKETFVFIMQSIQKEKEKNFRK